MMDDFDSVRFQGQTSKVRDPAAVSFSGGDVDAGGRTRHGGLQAQTESHSAEIPKRHR